MNTDNMNCDSSRIYTPASIRNDFIKRQSNRFFDVMKRMKGDMTNRKKYKDLHERQKHTRLNHLTALILT